VLNALKLNISLKLLLILMETKRWRKQPAALLLYRKREGKSERQKPLFPLTIDPRIQQIYL
jgi:hypothetical protein